MPAPLALSPLALTALRVGAIAAIAIYAARKRQSLARNMRREETLDAVDDGLELTGGSAPGTAQYDAAGRMRRTVRLGKNGPGVEIDVTGLARLRMRRV
ncbi:MAG: hypothetical protein AAGC92_14880 [Pseudomonadota bacterium]